MLTNPHFIVKLPTNWQYIRLLRCKKMQKEQGISLFPMQKVKIRERMCISTRGLKFNNNESLDKKKQKKTWNSKTIKNNNMKEWKIVEKIKIKTLE